MGQHESIHEFSGTFLIFLRRHSSTVSLGPRADLGSRTVKDSSTSLDFHNKSMFALNVTVGSLRPLTVCLYTLQITTYILSEILTEISRQSFTIKKIRKIKRKTKNQTLIKKKCDFNLYKMYCILSRDGQSFPIFMF